MSTLVDPPVEFSPARVDVLNDADRAELNALVDADPFVNVVLASRLRAIGTLAARTFGGTVFGTRDPAGRLSAAIFSAGTLLPIGGAEPDWRALGRHLASRPRTCTSIVGRDAAVAAVSEEVGAAWGAPRALRGAQLLLVLDRSDVGRPPLRDDAGVRLRRIRADEVESYLPAAAAMFTEELGASPYASGHPGDYRRRITGLVRQGRAFGVVDDRGQVLFKADIGAVSAHTCQVQGVWVHPELRGRGLGSQAMPQLLRYALEYAPSVSLYVNDFNTRARRMYARLGMRQAAVLSTVLY